MKRRYNDRKPFFESESEELISVQSCCSDFPEMKVAQSRKVSFAENSTIVGQSALFDELTEENCKQLWYQKDELSAMKKEVRFLLTQIGHFPTTLAQQQQKHNIPTVDQDDFLRQFETEDQTLAGLGRFGFQRTQYKRSALYYVLAAQREYLGKHKNEYLKAISRRCTGWARRVAAEEGFSVFCEVYGDPIENLLNASSWEEDLKSFNGSFAAVEEDTVTNSSAERQETNDPPAKRQRISMSEEDIKEVATNLFQ